MKFSTGSLALCAQLFFGVTIAQEPLSIDGVKVTTYLAGADMGMPEVVMGFSFPQNASKNEFIGYISGTGPGYTGLALGGSMINGPLVVAWADGKDVRTSIRTALGYTASPAIYKGGAEIKVLGKSVDGEKFHVTFRCIGCLSWKPMRNRKGINLSLDTIDMGWAKSTKAPAHPDNPESPVSSHVMGGGQGRWTYNTKEVVNANYA